MWHVHLIIAVNAGCALATAALALWWPAAYARARHRVVVGNRLVRFGTTVLAAAMENPRMQAYMLRTYTPDAARFVPAWTPPAGAAAGGWGEQLHAALTMLRPVTWPLLMLTQGTWAFRLSWWLPLQIANMAISCQWVLKQTVSGSRRGRRRGSGRA